MLRNFKTWLPTGWQVTQNEALATNILRKSPAPAKKKKVRQEQIHGLVTMKKEIEQEERSEQKRLTTGYNHKKYSEECRRTELRNK